MRIELTKRFRQEVRALSKSRRREIAHVLDRLHGAFGKPHLHSGLGVRRLRRDYFECRAGLHLRMIFRAQRGMLQFVTLGNHEHVRAFLKSV